VLFIRGILCQHFNHYLFLGGSFWLTSHVSQGGWGVNIKWDGSDDLTSSGHLREWSPAKLCIDYCLSFLPLKTVEGGDLWLSVWIVDGGAFHRVNCYHSELGSCVLKASTVKCQSIPSINTQSILDWHFDWHLLNTRSTSQSTVGCILTNFQSVRKWVVDTQPTTNCWLSVDQVSVEMLIRCWSVDQVSIRIFTTIATNLTIWLSNLPLSMKV